MTAGDPSLANRRGLLLLTALAMACLPWPGGRPEIAGAIEAWLSGWRGLGLVVDGMSPLALPHEIRPGDRVTVNGVEWEVAAPPAVYLAGKMQTVRLRKLGEPGVTDVERLPAHERVAVGRIRRAE